MSFHISLILLDHAVSGKVWLLLLEKAGEGGEREEDIKINSIRQHKENILDCFVYARYFQPPEIHLKNLFHITKDSLVLSKALL